MAAPTLTNPSIANSETSDVTKLTANDNDLLNAITDGTKDLTFSALTASGNIAFDGGSFTFNNSAADLDFLCKGNTDAQLFKLDAGTDAVLMGANADSASDFTNTKLIASTGNTGETGDTSNLGIVGEGAADGSNEGWGIEGVGLTSSSAGGGGIAGLGKVNAATDAYLAYGGYFQATDTHTGADNVAVWADAGNASSSGQNIALHIETGTIRITNSGTALSACDANAFQIGAEDLSGGNTQLSLRGEGTCVGSGTPTQDRTIAVKVNGTQYYIHASTSAS